MPQAIEHHITPTLTRRGLATCGAALAALAGLGAIAKAAPASPDADLLALCAEFHRHHADALSLPDAGDPDAGARTWEDAIDDRWDTLDSIEDMRPVTAEGHRAKAAVALVMMEEQYPGDEGNATARFATVMLRDLVGRA